MSVDAYIAQQRALLDRLEEFARTPEYERLLRTANQYASKDPEPSLAKWLTWPAFGLEGKIPIDVVTEPGGIDQLVDLLGRTETGTYT